MGGCPPQRVPRANKTHPLSRHQALSPSSYDALGSYLSSYEHTRHKTLANPEEWGYTALSTQSLIKDIV